MVLASSHLLVFQWLLHLSAGNESVSVDHASDHNVGHPEGSLIDLLALEKFMSIRPLATEQHRSSGLWPTLCLPFLQPIRCVRQGSTIFLQLLGFLQSDIAVLTGETESQRVQIPGL